MTVFVICAGEAAGEGVGVGEGATVLVVRGCVPSGEATGSGVTVAVGAGVVCNGVTVAVGRGPAGMSSSSVTSTESGGVGESPDCALIT